VDLEQEGIMDLTESWTLLQYDKDGRFWKECCCL